MCDDVLILSVFHESVSTIIKYVFYYRQVFCGKIAVHQIAETKVLRLTYMSESWFDVELIRTVFVGV